MYESFYRLSTKPFGLNPDPDFIFTRRGHELAMAHLRYGISQSTGFVVITGAPGTGKTTLARVLLKELANNTTIVVAHLPSTHLAADDLLRVVADSFGLKYEGLSKPEILKLLNNFLLTCVRERKRTLLVIDEAQNLPACAFEELRLLANLRLGAKALLQTILLGQEQFRQMLGSQEFSQIMQRVVANYHLVPLTLEETQAYIESRLIHANWQGNPHFSDEAIYCIHEHTEGIPRRINKFCERLLLYGYLEERTEISQDIVQVVINEFQQETPVSQRRPEDIEIDEIAQTEPLSVPYEIENEIAEATQTNSSDEHKEIEGSLIDFSINSENSNAETISSTQEKIESTPPVTEKINQNRGSHSLESPPLIETSNDVDKLKEKKEPAENIHSVSEIFSLIPQEQEKTEDKNESAPQELSAEETQNTDKSEQKQERIIEAEQEALAAIEAENSNLKSDIGELEESTAIAMAHSSQLSSNVSEVPAANRTKFRVIDGGKDSRSTSQPINSNLQQSSTNKDIEHKLLKLVLAFQLSPKHFEYLTDPEQPSPENAGRLLELATTDNTTIATALPQSLRGISQQNLQTAINFYIWEVILKPGGNDYRTLGLQENAPISEIKTHYQNLRLFLNNQKADHENGIEYISRIEKAYTNLTNEAEIENNFLELPTTPGPKQKSRAEIDRIEEAYEILSEETIDSTEILEPPFKKSGSNGQSTTYTKYLIFGLIATAIGVTVYKTQFTTNESEHLTTEIEPTNKQPEKAVIFGAKNNSSEVIDEPIINNTDIYQHDPNTDIASTESTVETESDNFTLLDGDDPWAEYSEISEKIAQAPSEPPPSEDSFIVEQPIITPEPVASTLQKEITTTPEVIQTSKPDIVENQPIAVATPKALPIATLYSDRVTTKAVTPAPDNNIEKLDLINLINNFTTAYEQGDINQFMKLFSIDATSFDGTTQTDRNGIEADYIDLFQTTTARQIAIKNIAWNTNHNTSEGISDFVVTVKSIDNDQLEFISGIITLEVEKNQQNVFITRLTYQVTE